MPVLGLTDKTILLRVSASFYQDITPGVSHKATVRALVPLFVASIAVLVVVAGAVGSAGKNLIVHLPVVTGAPWRSSDGVVVAIGDADSLAVKLCRSAVEILLVLRCVGVDPRESYRVARARREVMLRNCIVTCDVRERDNEDSGWD